MLGSCNFVAFKFWREVLIAAFLAVFAGFLANFPLLDHFGGISLALIAGMLGKAFIWKRTAGSGGLTFASKTLLRLGIVLLGTRLNFVVLVHAGLQVVGFDLLMIVLGIGLITFILRRTGFEPTLAVLAAVGSSICGASAIAAAAPAVRASKENSALAIVVCTLIGTAATFLLIPLQGVAGLAPEKYGILAGATLHEVAQVVAAVGPVPDAFQTGMVTKLLRVVFLAPVVAVLPRITRQPIGDPAPGRHRFRWEAPSASLVRRRFSPHRAGGYFYRLSSRSRTRLSRRWDKGTRPTHEFSDRNLHGRDWSASRLCHIEKAWAEADAHCRWLLADSFLSCVRTLFDLELTQTPKLETLTRRVEAA